MWGSLLLASSQGIPQRSLEIVQELAADGLKCLSEHPWLATFLTVMSRDGIPFGIGIPLRTGETLKLQVKDVVLSRQHGVVTIRRSKTGIRFDVDESVAINDRTLFSLWKCCHLARALAPGDLTWNRSAPASRQKFYEGLQFFGLAPYSIRRRGQSVESILLRSRWRTAGGKIVH